MMQFAKQVGELVRSFLSPHSDKREDEYEGSFENRMMQFPEINNFVEGTM